MNHKLLIQILIKHLFAHSLLSFLEFLQIFCFLDLKILVKACVHYFLSSFYFSPNDSPSKTMKNVFFFI